MKKRRLSRIDLYKKICRHVGLPVENDIVGYFSTKQLRLVWEYIEKTDKKEEVQDDKK